MPDLGRAGVVATAARLRAAQPAWEAIGPEGRAEHMLRFLDRISDNQVRIVGVMQEESGKFGRPIGTFQAIKHKCTDVLVDVEAARSAAYHGLWGAARQDTGDGEALSIAASLAKASCPDAYFHAAAENIQIHGGIGFTWEHPAHLDFARLK